MNRNWKLLLSKSYILLYSSWLLDIYFLEICISPLTLFRMVIFGAAQRWGCGGGKKSPLLKICHTYPAMMKLSTVIPYLKKIPKLYKSRDTPPEFCWHQHFFPEISKFCYINKCRYRLYWYIVSYSFNFLINLVKILMMSAKMATQIFLK